MSYLRLTCGLLVCLILLGLLFADLPAYSATSRKVGSSAALLASLYQRHPELVPPDALPFADTTGFRGILSLHRDPTPAESAEMRRMGVDLAGGEMRKAKGLLKQGRIPWHALQALSRLDVVETVESSWQPGVWPALDLSAQSIQATGLWPPLGLSSQGSDGAGVVIADFDTGVDVFHPGVWRANGPELGWIDVNGNLAFDAGVDAVDLNGNGAGDAGETLRFAKAQVKDYRGVITNSAGPFNAKLDWLYNDANGNSVRDYGASYGESAPNYGEPVFVVKDANQDGMLSPGEKLMSLGTCKIGATLGLGGVTRTRGIDLIQTAADTNGHGTAVCGILAGQTPWYRKYTGVAPGADILVADYSKNDFSVYIPWAESRGAKVMLYEFGAWTFQFMDGSSPLEQAISSAWERGIAQVVPAGNLANGRKHAMTNTAGGSATFDLSVPSGRSVVYLTLLWRNSTNELGFSVTNPSGLTVTMPGDGKFYTDSSGNQFWSYGIQESSRGTRRFDIAIYGVTAGAWRLNVTSVQDVQMHAYISDNVGGWSGGVYFLSNLSLASTVSWPATADNALVVGSFSTRGIYVPAGEISNSSGLGPRIDGRSLVDICAPGNYDIFTICSKDANNPAGSFRQFSGTSAAAPHVAGGCALLLRLNPLLTCDEISSILTSTAQSDAFTGIVPNDTWGYGKLDVLSASQGVDAGLPMTARTAKELPDGTPVVLFGKIVVAAWPDKGFFYVEESDRSSGIRVLGGGVAEGDRVRVSGMVITHGLECVIQADSVIVLQHNQVLPKPLLTANWNVGDLRTGNIGPDTIGLLMTTYGQVGDVSADGFVLDDGNFFPVWIQADDLTLPSPGMGAFATGVCSVDMGESGIRRVLLPRRNEDVKTY